MYYFRNGRLSVVQRRWHGIRKNLIHGTHAVLPYLVERQTLLGRWARGVVARAPKNVAVVAQAHVCTVGACVLCQDQCGATLAARRREFPGDWQQEQFL